MLQRLSLGTALDEFAHLGEFRLGERALEIQIQLEARLAERVGEEQLDLQARGIDAFFGEKIRAALDDIEDGHRIKIGSIREVQRVKF